MKNGNYKIGIEQRLSRIETTLDEIANNHLVHLSDDMKELQAKIGNINVKLGYWSGGIVVAIWVLEKIIK